MPDETDDDDDDDGFAALANLPSLARPVTTDGPVPALRYVPDDPDRRGSHEVEIKWVEVPPVHYVGMHYMGGGTERRSLKLEVVPGRYNPDGVACWFHLSRDGLVEFHRQLGSWLALTAGESDVDHMASRGESAATAAAPAPLLRDSLIQLGVIAQSLRSDGVIGRADDLRRVADDIQRAAAHMSWLAPPPASAVQSELGARATVISLQEASAIARRSAAHHKDDPDSTAWPPMWVIDAVLAGSRAGHVAARIQDPDERAVWAAALDRANSAHPQPASPPMSIYDSAIPDLPSGKYKEVDILGHRFRFMATHETAANTGRRLYSVYCITCVLPVDSHTTAPDLAAEQHVNRTRTHKQYLETQRAKEATMPIPTSADLKTTVFRILMLDGKRRGEYRLICIAGRTRVEYPIKNEIDETAWVSTDESNRRDGGELVSSHDNVVSIMNRLIALRASLGEPLRFVVNTTTRCEIDLGTIDLALVADADA